VQFFITRQSKNYFNVKEEKKATREDLRR